MAFAIERSPATGTDVISDVLRSIRLEGTFYFEAQLAAPWGIHMNRSDYANFHQVLAGLYF